MHRASVLLLLVLASFAPSLSCGSGSGRQLQSITITQTVNGEQIQFTATGTFSAAPTTVTPLPVTWGAGLFAPPPPGNLGYQLSTQPFLLTCTNSGPELSVNAWAPPDPNTPSSGSWPFKQMIIGSAAVTCP